MRNCEACLYYNNYFDDCRYDGDCNIKEKEKNNNDKSVVQLYEYRQTYNQGFDKGVEKFAKEMKMATKKDGLNYEKKINEIEKKLIDEK